MVPEVVQLAHRGGATKRVIASAAATSILAVTAVTAVTMLVINEAVRSDGAL